MLKFVTPSKFVILGTSEGGIMVFDIPPRGTAVKLQETLTSHKTAICELEAQGGRMVSSDEEGNIILWQSGGHFTEIIKIDGKGLAITSFFCLKSTSHFCDVIDVPSSKKTEVKNVLLSGKI